jgi:hypothetical protein
MTISSWWGSRRRILVRFGSGGVGLVCSKAITIRAARSTSPGLSRAIVFAGSTRSARSAAAPADGASGSDGSAGIAMASRGRPIHGGSPS